jgi:hypothetical protein
MRFLQPDLLQSDRAGFRRWNDRGTSSVFHFFLFTHHQHLSAQLSGISAIATLHVDASILMIRAHPQYIAILHGKESHHE